MVIGIIICASPSEVVFFINPVLFIAPGAPDQVILPASACKSIMPPTELLSTLPLPEINKSPFDVIVKVPSLFRVVPPAILLFAVPVKFITPAFVNVLIVPLSVPLDQLNVTSSSIVEASENVRLVFISKTEVP